MKHTSIAVLASLLVASTALSLTGCEDTEKKAMEAKKVADEAAAKVKAEADALAAATTKKMLDSQKESLTAKITDGVKALNMKLTFLKEKAAKLPAPVKAKADAAFAAFDTAKGNVTALTTSVTSLTSLTDAPALMSKISTGLDGAKAALEAAEAIVIKKK